MKLPNCLLKCLYCFVFLPTTNESSCGSTFLPEIAILSFLHCSPSNRCEVVSCFNLHFPNYKLCWASFHMWTCYVCIFFSEACLDLFPFFSVFFFLLFHFLEIFGSQFRHVFCKYFPQAVVCLFILLKMSYTEKKLILIKSKLSIFFIDHSFAVESKNVSSNSWLCMFVSLASRSFILLHLNLCRWSIWLNFCGGWKVCA